MKKLAILLLFACIALVGYFFFLSQPNKTVSPLAALISKRKPTPTKILMQQSSSALFVPYWSFNSQDINTNDYDTVLYFGVSGNEQGIDKQDNGYKKLDQFNHVTSSTSKKLLVIRMIDSSINSKVLDNPLAQEKVIEQSIALAKDHGYLGIVLDFEIKALAFDSVVKNIATFYTNFAKQTHRSNLQFDVTLYGDMFYLARPYDVKTIGAVSDNIYIMTYDFHKAGGDPGPNFPLRGKNTYGYDLASMIEDFSKQVDPKKIIVTVGLFGYDWQVDEKGESVSAGVPLSYSDIHAKYLTTCTEKDCRITRDKNSLETKITYTDEAGKRHIIWFEDPASAEKKRQYLKSVGLNASAVWAYSYF